MTPKYSTVTKKLFPLFAERHYQPTRIGYLLSLSTLIGASSEISGAERTLLQFSQIWAAFSKIYLKISVS